MVIVHGERSYKHISHLFFKWGHLDSTPVVRVLSCFSHVQLLVTLWSVACQAPLHMGFSRQEYWGGLPFSPPGDFSDPGIESVSLLLHWQVGSLPLVAHIHFNSQKYYLYHQGDSSDLFVSNKAEINFRLEIIFYYIR